MPGQDERQRQNRAGNFHFNILQDNQLGWESVTNGENTDKESSQTEQSVKRSGQVGLTAIHMLMFLGASAGPGTVRGDGNSGIIGHVHESGSLPLRDLQAVSSQSPQHQRE